MTVTHDDERYAAALAHVGLCISAAEAVHIHTTALLADLRRPRCACCGHRFTPEPRRHPQGGRQVYCREPGCARLRHRLKVRRYRLHIHAVRLDRTPLGRDLVCPCGAILQVEILAGGTVVDHCAVCGAVVLTRRAAA